ncbi:MAG TPA: RuvX/YqgF family protein [Candidatus Paceibacterota bacterium]
MKYLGIDFGMKRVGVAVSNDEATIAFPRVTLKNEETLVPQIVEIIEKEKIGAIVIGDTRALSGAPNPIVSLSVDLFIEELKDAIQIPIHTAFEAWSSIEASRYAPKGKEHDDAAAAAIILQRFLDSKKTNL